jgi:hypothetical protein
MVESKIDSEMADNLRIEYSAVVNYHNDLVKSRFTIAGLYIAAIGFVVGAVFKESSTITCQLICSMFACWIAFCLWIIELRSRGLYTSLAMRGKDIEHRHWNLTGPDWYEGFFSRQHKEKPAQNEIEYAGNVSEKPEYDRMKIAWMQNKLPESICKYISHSWGFDLLYAGTGLFWFIMFIVSFVKFLLATKGC